MKRRRRKKRKKRKKKAVARRVVEPQDAKDTCSGRSCECARSLWLDERERENERNRRIAKTSSSLIFCALPLDICACIKSLMKYLHMYMHM